MERLASTASRTGIARGLARAIPLVPEMVVVEKTRSIPVFLLTAGQSRSKSSDITVDSDHAIVFGFALPVSFIRLNAKEIK